jgi:hypothetical protein
LVASLLDSKQASAEELAAPYHDHWEIETALDELKSYLRGANIVFRRKIADLARQEFYGLILAHFANRGLMHDDAPTANADPDQLSFVRAVRVVRRKLATFHAIPPQQRKEFHECVLQEILQEGVVSSRDRRNVRGVKRKVSKFPICRRLAPRLFSIDNEKAIKILK